MSIPTVQAHKLSVDDFQELYSARSAMGQSDVLSGRRSCPVCQSRGLWVFSKHGVRVLDCGNCYHRFADIDPVDQHTDALYAVDYFTEGADGYVNYIGDGHLVQDRAGWYARLLRKQGVRCGHVLDVGAAAGFFLKGLTEFGWTGAGLEPNTEMVRYGREELKLDLRRGSLETLAAEESFDLVSMIQVVAHLVDPAEAFYKAALHTRQGGHWIVETWNYRSLCARLFGQLWHEYSPPRTLHWFSPRSIQKLASQFGMELISSGHPDKSISGEHAKSLIQHATAGSAVARVIAAPARLIPNGFRIPYLADDLNWFLFRKT